MGRLLNAPKDFEPLKLNLYKIKDEEQFKSDLKKFIQDEIATKNTEKERKQLRENYKAIKECCYTILSFIMPTVKRRNNSKELNRDLLRNLSTFMVPAKKFLLDYNYIKVTRNHLAGNHSKHYGIVIEKHEGQCLEELLPTVKTLSTVNLVVNWREKIGSKIQEISDEDTDHKFLKDPLFNLRIHKEKALQFIQYARENGLIDREQELNMKLTANQMNDPEKQYLFKDLFSGRMHSLLTNAKSEIRHFMYFEGHEEDELVSLDISNSQFFLSSVLTTEKGLNTMKEIGINEESISFIKENKDNQDAKLYIEKCQNGSIYEFLQEKAKGTYFEMAFKTRLDSKKAMFHINFAQKTDEEYSFFKKVKFNHFRKNFPSFFSFIEKVRNDSPSKSYPKLLQSLEVNTIVNVASKSLYDNGIDSFGTIHDSILVPSKYKDKALELLKDAFLQDYGVIPTIKVEYYGLNHFTEEIKNKNHIKPKKKKK